MLGERYSLQNVGYDVVLGGIVSTGGLAMHFMLFQPQFDAYNLMGLKGGTLADLLVGTLSIVATYKWLNKTVWKVAGYIIGSTLIGLGIVHQFNLIPQLTAPATLAPSLRPNIPLTAPRVAQLPIGGAKAF